MQSYTMGWWVFTRCLRLLKIGCLSSLHTDKDNTMYRFYMMKYVRVYIYIKQHTAVSNDFQLIIVKMI